MEQHCDAEGDKEMNNKRAWKSIDDRNSLSMAERATLPAAPAGALVLTEEDLGAVVGGVMQNSDPCEGGEGKRN
jgi:mersacidin/lichenicidin family type 2 lantibiotic